MDTRPLDQDPRSLEEKIGDQLVYYEVTSQRLLPSPICFYCSAVISDYSMRFTYEAGPIPTVDMEIINIAGAPPGVPLLCQVVTRAGCMSQVLVHPEILEAYLRLRKKLNW